MITGAHVLLYTTDADADRTFFKDVLGFRSVDAGHGWLIFALPPAELAVHPGDGTFTQVNAHEKMLGALLYLMCDDVAAMVESLAGKGVACTPLQQEGWGMRTTLRLPSGGSIGLYQPSHPTPTAN